MGRLYRIIKIVLKFTVAMLLLNAFWYVIGAFIAQQNDPTKWWLLSTIIGQVIFVILEIGFAHMSLEVATNEI